MAEQPLPLWLTVPPLHPQASLVYRGSWWRADTGDSTECHHVADEATKLYHPALATWDDTTLRATVCCWGPLKQILGRPQFKGHVKVTASGRRHAGRGRGPAPGTPDAAAPPESCGWVATFGPSLVLNLCPLPFISHDTCHRRPACFPARRCPHHQSL
jgi:hypothetical protein